MSYFLTYFFIGTVYMFVIELIADWLMSKGSADLKKDLTAGSRFMGILIWPIGMVVFVYNYIKTRYKL
tara:strand:- start:134 stop:337 length:204 start_codon:yes stop_codon:yes gene_type:complete